VSISKPCSPNELLSCLPDDVRARVTPFLENVHLPSGRSLYESCAYFRYVYFPLNGTVALHGLTENGSTSMLSLVGREGLVGVSSFMGGLSMNSNATVLTGGNFLRMPAADLLREFERSLPLLHLLLRYTQALIAQMAQTAMCNRHHTLEKAFSRCLLLCLDRTTGNELLLTHGQMAHLLGVRREGVTEAAFRLQHLGLIRYARGHITILDRQGLEQGTCECYSAIKSEYDRLLPMRMAA
jgi:CRP-like cAMP-binding protein